MADNRLDEDLSNMDDSSQYMDSGGYGSSAMPKDAVWKRGQAPMHATPYYSCCCLCCCSPAHRQTWLPVECDVGELKLSVHSPVGMPIFVARSVWSELQAQPTSGRG